MAEQHGLRCAGRGEARREPGQPGRSRLRELPGRGVDTDPDGRGVAGPGDDSGAGAGRRPQGLRHAGGGAVRVARPVEGRGVDVGAGDDHGHLAGPLEVPVDLGDLAPAARVEGEDLPAGQPLVRGAPQGKGVGPVAQPDRYAVEVADDERMAADQPLLLVLAQGPEERGDFRGRRRSRIGQRPVQRGVRRPRGAARRRSRHRALGVLRGPSGGSRGHRRRERDGGQGPLVAAHGSASLFPTPLLWREEGRRTTGDGTSHRGANSGVVPEYHREEKERNGRQGLSRRPRPAGPGPTRTRRSRPAPGRAGRAWPAPARCAS